MCTAVIINEPAQAMSFAELHALLGAIDELPDGGFDHVRDLALFDVAAPSAADDVGSGFEDLRQGQRKPPAFTLPAGVQSRSHGHMAMLRLHRKSLGSKASSIASERAKYDSLADAWGTMVLRCGDRAQRSQDPGGAHPNQWTVAGMLRITFQELGRPVKRMYVDVIFRTRPGAQRL